MDTAYPLPAPCTQYLGPTSKHGAVCIVSALDALLLHHKFPAGLSLLLQTGFGRSLCAQLDRSREHAALREQWAVAFLVHLDPPARTLPAAGRNTRARYLILLPPGPDFSLQSRALEPHQPLHQHLLKTRELLCAAASSLHITKPSTTTPAPDSPHLSLQVAGGRHSSWSDPSVLRLQRKKKRVIISLRLETQRLTPTACAYWPSAHPRHIPPEDTSYSLHRPLVCISGALAFSPGPLQPPPPPPTRAGRVGLTVSIRCIPALDATKLTCPQLCQHPFVFSFLRAYRPKCHR